MDIVPLQHEVDNQLGNVAYLEAKILAPLGSYNMQDQRRYRPALNLRWSMITLIKTLLLRIARWCRYRNRIAGPSL
jgi:hypothetical protein